jgi:hypothetical protein
MSDDPTQAAEPAETAQGAVESEAPIAPPWGDDFNPERAWKTILTQRDREKELESDAKAWKRFREDEEFRRQELAGLGYELNEDTDEEEYDQPQFVSREEFERWQHEQQAAASAQAFTQDLKELTRERELSKHGRELITARFQRGDFSGPDDLKTALDEWYAYEDSLKESGLRSRPKPPTSPSPPQPGRAGDAEFDRRSATPAQRKAHREKLLAAQFAAEGQQT